MGKLAFIFPGQGAQYVGMGKQIASEFKSASAVFDEASETLGIDMKKMIFDEDDETLKITENTQPAILTTSIACLAPLIERGIKPDFTAGLSLGEYSAHVASGTMSFSAAVSLVRKRGKYMQEAVPVGVGGMAAIIGLSADDVKHCCQQASEYGIVEPANFNCPGQIAIAGEVRALDKAIEYCNAKGAIRAIKLPVSAPFHCSMLKPAGELLDAELEHVVFKDFESLLVANCTAQIVESPDKIRDTLVKQVSSPVLWEDSIRFMIEKGVDTFVEIGPGKVLSGFVKKINKEVLTLNVENLDSLNITLGKIRQ